MWMFVCDHITEKRPVLNYIYIIAAPTFNKEPFWAGLENSMDRWGWWVATVRYNWETNSTTTTTTTTATHWAGLLRLSYKLPHNRALLTLTLRER